MTEEDFPEGGITMPDTMRLVSVRAADMYGDVPIAKVDRLTEDGVETTNPDADGNVSMELNVGDYVYVTLDEQEAARRLRDGEL